MGADRSPPGEKTKNLGSYYRRPSAAVEQGGGFFVPGLQGFRCVCTAHRQMVRVMRTCVTAFSCVKQRNWRKESTYALLLAAVATKHRTSDACVSGVAQLGQ